MTTTFADFAAECDARNTILLSMIKETKGTVAFCAFNKSIAKEIEYKVNQQKNINKDIKG